jgi:hypothetical protein
MDELYPILTPLLVLAVLALARFVGCDLVFKLESPPVTAFVESTVLGSLRNNFSGWVGMAIQVGSAEIKVTALGRTMLTPSAQEHVVKIVRPAGEDGVDLGSVTIPPSAATSGFAYATLSQTVTLLPSQTYYVVSHEVAGGDSWHDALGTALTTTDVATVISAVFNADSDPRYVLNDAGDSFGPVDFKYFDP